VPRRKAVELTKEQALPGFALLHRTLDQPRHQMAARQFQLAALEFRQFLELVDRKGDDGAIGAAELNTVYYALLTSALLLYKDRKIRRRFVSVLDVHKALGNDLVILFGRHHLGLLPLRMFRPRGPRPGSQREYARLVEPSEESFAERVRKARAVLGEHATHAEICEYLGWSTTTYYRYLAEERRRYEISGSDPGESV
jgi:hypothetical protein